MITFGTAAEWQQWFDETFPEGARVAASDGWVITPRVHVLRVEKGEVEVEYAQLGVDRILVSRFTGVEKEQWRGYAHPQYVMQGSVPGYLKGRFSRDVAAVDAKELAAARAEEMAS